MKLSVEEMHEYATEMLEEVVAICEKHEIDYFLGYGSVLGAIRHKGPIPWDSDIDLLVPYPQLEKFVEKVRSELPDKFYLNYHDINKSYASLFPRVGLKGYSTGWLHLDIFIMIGAPNDKAEQDKIVKRGLKFDKALHYKNPTDSYFEFKKLGLKSKVKNYPFIFLMGFVPLRYFIKRYERFCVKYNYDKSNLIVNSSFGYANKEFIPKSFLGKGKLAGYRNIKAQIPEKYHEYLTHFYGDYMKFPPEEERGHKEIYPIVELKE